MKLATTNTKPPRHVLVMLTIIAIYAILSGFNEVTVGITGNFLGILSKPLPPSIWTAIVGSFYTLGGLALLTRKRWGMWLSVGFIGAEVIGRFVLIPLGIVPSHGVDLLKVIVGALIAVALVVYIIVERKYFK